MATRVTCEDLDTGEAAVVGPVRARLPSMAAYASSHDRDDGAMGKG